MSTQPILFRNATTVLPSQAPVIASDVRKVAVSLQLILSCIGSCASQLIDRISVSSSLLTGGLGLTAIKDIVTTAKGMKYNRAERVRKGFDLTYSVKSLVSSICSIFEGFQSIGMLSGKAVRWIKPVSTICVPFDAIAAGTGAVDTYKLESVEKELQHGLERSSKARTVKKKMQALEGVCKALGDEKSSVYSLAELKEDKVKKISKLAAKLGKEAVRSKSNKKQKRQLLNKCVKVFSSLKKRIHELKLLSLIDTISSVVALAFSILLLFSPASLFYLSMVAATTVICTYCFFKKKFFLSEKVE